MKVNIKKVGFTLIETLTYIAIFGIVFTVIVQFTIVTTQNNNIAQTRKEIGDLGAFLNFSIEESFNISSTINSTNSIYNNDNGRIVLIRQNGTMIQYYLINNIIRISRDSLETDLVYGDIRCNRFFIQPINNTSGVPRGARITINCFSTKYSQVDSQIITNYLLNI